VNFYCQHFHVNNFFEEAELNANFRIFTLRMVNLKLINTAGVELKDQKPGNVFVFCIATMAILLNQARSNIWC